MGDLAVHGHKALIFQDQKCSNLDVEKAKLTSARYVMWSEANANVKLDVAAIQEIAGGDSYTCRRLYGESVDVQPHWLPILATNWLPVIPEVKRSIALRFHALVKFPVEFSQLAPGEVESLHHREPDLLLKKKVFADGGRAFLAWLVEGAYRYYQDPRKLKLTTPQKFVDDAKQWIDKQDRLTAYINLECDRKVNEGVNAGEFRRRYIHYAGVAISGTQMNDAMEAKGFPYRRLQQERCYVGLMWKPERKENVAFVAED